LSRGLTVDTYARRAPRPWLIAGLAEGDLLKGGRHRRRPRAGRW
jgi:hypothetical protein